MLWPGARMGVSSSDDSTEAQAASEVGPLGLRHEDLGAVVMNQGSDRHFRSAAARDQDQPLTREAG